MPDDRSEARISLLRREIVALLRDTPGGCRSVNARIGDCALEVTWEPGCATPAPAREFADAVGTHPLIAAGDDDGLRTLVAPMVGTLYRSREPGAGPFVEVGDTVQVGQPVAIIEAMKLMNTIEAEVAGVVSEILVDNGASVEFGQPILRVKPGEA